MTIDDDIRETAIGIVGWDRRFDEDRRRIEEALQKERDRSARELAEARRVVDEVRAWLGGRGSSTEATPEKWAELEAILSRHEAKT